MYKKDIYVTVLNQSKIAIKPNKKACSWYKEESS